MLTGPAGVPISEFPHFGTTRPGAVEVRIWCIGFLEALKFFYVELTVERFAHLWHGRPFGARFQFLY